MDTESDFDFNFCDSDRPATPTEPVEAAAKASEELLPMKSKGRYKEVYNNYQKWKESKKATSDSERVVLVYIIEMTNVKNKKGENPKASTLWARFSMLKATLKIFANFDISTYAKVTAFLERKSDGYVPKKAHVFTNEEIQNFLDSAPDVAWLHVKVTSLFQCYFSFLIHLYMAGRLRVLHVWC